jgi:hypothetical protein
MVAVGDGGSMVEGLGGLLYGQTRPRVLETSRSIVKLLVLVQVNLGVFPAVASILKHASRME